MMKIYWMKGNKYVLFLNILKMKWLVLGVVTICALGWAASVFGPELMSMFDAE